jgi:hypothetical protein
MDCSEYGNVAATWATSALWTACDNRPSSAAFACSYSPARDSVDTPDASTAFSCASRSSANATPAACPAATFHGTPEWRFWSRWSAADPLRCDLSTAWNWYNFAARSASSTANAAVASGSAPGESASDQHCRIADSADSSECPGPDGATVWSARSAGASGAASLPSTRNPFGFAVANDIFPPLGSSQFSECSRGFISSGHSFATEAAGFAIYPPSRSQCAVGGVGLPCELAKEAEDDGRSAPASATAKCTAIFAPDSFAVFTGERHPQDTSRTFPTKE